MGQRCDELGLEAYPHLSRDAALLLFYFTGWIEIFRAKRTCRLNAGLSHSCDYKDTLDAIHEGMYLGSDMTPGKK